MNIWFASNNKHKQSELAAILGRELIIPSCAGLDFNPDETGNSFLDNALIKAGELYRLLSLSKNELYKPGDLIIADDSGICLDGLGGRPGIYSSRYPYLGGPPESPAKIPPSANVSAIEKKLTSDEQNGILLEELNDNKNRNARFICAMVLLISENRFFVAQETMEGRIVSREEGARGKGGFGYDPILFIPELGKTVAELSTEEKNRLSHRAKAGKKIKDILNGI